MPKRIQRRRAAGWRKPEGAVCESERRQIKIDAERRAATIRLDAAMRAVREAQADLAKIDADAGRLP